MANTETIQVLGRGTNVDFTIDDSVPFELAERSLREYLLACRGLYSRGTVSINVGRRILAPDQMSTIRGILNQESGLTVSRYWCSPEVLRRALSGPESRRALPPPNSVPADPSIQSRKSAGRTQSATEQLRGAPFLGESDYSKVAEVAIEAEADQPQQLSMLFPELDTGNSGSLTVQIPIVATDGENESPADTETAAENAEGATLESGVDATLDPTRELALAIENDEDEEKRNVVEGNDSLEPAVPPSESDSWLSPNAWLARSDQALMIKHTCRSGEVVKHHGDVVVYGDVNPGAEIIAGGDILVLGALRGMAHAGAEGNPKATIFALKLESHRLQIGSHVGEAPRSVGKSKRNGRAVNPQIAYLRRRTIYVAPFTQRREEYGGGTPYEG